VPTLDREGDVWIINLGDGENRFHPDWIEQVSGFVDQVAAEATPRALVTTGTGKIYSNGLDLDWLGQNTDQLDDYVASVHELLAKFLAAPMVTVAAIQGHAFAAGAMLTLAHDLRVMRADRGYWCLPEADINIPFAHGMNALIQCKLTPQAQTDAMVTAQRFGGDAAQEAGIVDSTQPENLVLSQAVEMAAAQAGKDGGTLGTIKDRMYEPVLDALRDRERNRLVVPAA
jgi:enoyl-CoA hydratase/carnithine racemase